MLGTKAVELKYFAESGNEFPLDRTRMFKDDRICNNNTQAAFQSKNFQLQFIFTEYTQRILSHICFQTEYWGKWWNMPNVGKGNPGRVRHQW